MSKKNEGSFTKLSIHTINERILKYNSECIEYNGYRHLSKFRCLECSHEWGNSISRQSWCPKCNPDKNGSGGHSNMKASIDDINKNIEKYNSICVEYNGTHKPSTFQCNNCHHKWDNFIRVNAWCPNCHIDKIGSGTNNPNKISNKQYIKSLKDRKITLLEDYKGSHTKIKFQCDICHHKWITVPHRVKSGTGCPNCANITKSKKNHWTPYNKPTLLYVVYFPKYKTYKVGITTRSVKQRFERVHSNYVIIHQEKFLVGETAWKKEQMLLSKSKKHKFNGIKFLKSGYHECRSTNPTGL